MPIKDPIARAAHHRRYMREVWYPANKNKHLAFVEKQQKKLCEKINALKNKPCADCGVLFPHCVMDWDHVRGEKGKNVSTLAAGGCSNLVMMEIEKCELVCANCHRIRTFERREQARRGAVTARLPHKQQVAGVIPAGATNFRDCNDR